MGLEPLLGTDDEDTDVKVSEDSLTNGIDRTRGCVRLVSYKFSESVLSTLSAGHQILTNSHVTRDRVQ